jgi:D-glycero-D-manno-heptose 1,7-bisphosphate phosphatase
MTGALFLDRDGVINVDLGYVGSQDRFQFVEEIFDLVRGARRLGMKVVVVTNQAGIGRGFYEEADFQKLTEWMRGRFEESGAPIDAVYHCPFHPTHGIGRYKAESFDRKPNPGMILRARDDLCIDLGRSAMVGDTVSDMHAALRAGIPIRCLFGAQVREAGGTKFHTHEVGCLREVIRLLHTLDR